jgi:protein gp37
MRCGEEVLHAHDLLGMAGRHHPEVLDKETDALVQIPAVVHFISAEPLLEDISCTLNLGYIEWLIVGGESGPGFRPLDHAWARALRDRCARKEWCSFSNSPQVCEAKWAWSWTAESIMTCLT